MKKMIALCLVAALLSASYAFAESDSQPADPESLKFESKWISDLYTADIWYEEEGFRVSVIWEDLTDRIQWDYNCYYAAETGTLVSVSAIKSHGSLEDIENNTGWVTDYENLENDVTFAVNENGNLTWQDPIENAGEGLEFKKIGHFEGTWFCDRAEIEITWADEWYTIFITWANSASEERQWMLNGFYQAEDNTVEGLGMETLVVYDENGNVVSSTDVNPEGCKAVFSFNEEGKLLWQDEQVPETEGLQFEKDMLK